MQILKRYPWMMASLIYSGLVLLYFFPTLPVFSTELIGPPEDNSILYWDIWYAANALFGELPLMHTTHMYFSEGVNLFFNDYFYLGGFIYAFLKSFVSPVVYYNGMVLLSFVFSSLSAFIFLRYLTKNTIASLIGGFVFGFCPQHYGRSMHHVHLASMEFIPLYALFLFKTVREQKWRYVLYAAICFVLNALVSWNYALYTALFTGLACVWLFWKQRAFFLKKTLPRIATIAALSFACLSFWILPMISLSNQYPEIKLEGFDTNVVNLMYLFVPNSFHWLMESPWSSNLNKFINSGVWERASYLGLVNLMLLLVAGKALIKYHRKYLIGVAIFILISFGVSLHIHTWEIPMFLPYDVLQNLPLFSHARNPSRMMVYVYLFLAILVAFSIKEIFFKSLLTKKRKVLLAVVALLICLDYYGIVTVTTPVKLPPAYAAIQEDPESDFGILEVPWQGGIYQMYQVTHGRPTVQGYIGRKMGKTLVQKIPFEPPHLEIQKLILNKHRVKYIVIHKRLLWHRGRHYRERPMEGKELELFKYFQTLSNEYAKIYERVHEDLNHAVFRVYEKRTT